MSREKYTGNIIDASNFSRRVARGGVYVLTSQLLRFSLQLITGIVLARILAPNDFGLVAMAMSVIGLAGVFQDLGLSSAMIQEKNVSYAQVSQLFWINALIGILVSGLVFLSAPLLGRFYADEKIVLIVYCMSPIFFIDSMGVQYRALAQRMLRFSSLAIVDVVVVLAYSVAAIGLATILESYWALILGLVFKSGMNTILLMIVSSWSPEWPSRSVRIRSLITFGANITIAKLITYSSRNLDNVLIGRVWGPDSLGYYARAYQLFFLPIQQLINPIGSVMIPALSRLYHSDPEQYREMYRGVVATILLFASPFIVVMALNSDYVVVSLLGDEWSPTAKILVFLSFVGLLQPLSSSTGWLLISQGRSREILFWGIVSGILTALSFVVGLPWGAIGVAMSYSVSGILIRTPILLYIVGRKGPIAFRDLFLLAMLPVIIAVVVTIFDQVLKQMFELSGAAQVASSLMFGTSVSVVAFIRMGTTRKYLIWFLHNHRK